MRNCFGNGCGEAVEAERFKKVVDGGDFVAVDGKLRMSSGENHHRWFGERTDEFKTIEIGHVDVGNNQVDISR